ncbi:MAG: N-acetylglucosamine-6-phosphate deacetylase [Bryobacterales bacterium]|nr:N-acetylglucosamine-6-phosphate deacetylase [Bryobacterales bacterium]
MTACGIDPRTGQTVRVSVAEGQISQVTESTEDTDRHISPGWMDLQVNGFAGIDYNDPRSPMDEIARSIDVQRSTGVARLYPTVITGSGPDMEGSLRNLARARRVLPNGDAFLGFHVEGPWISPHDGPRGAHPKQHVRAPSIEEFERFQDAAEGLVRLVTLGPEHERACRVIEHMVEHGVVVSIGHTNATAEQISDAVLAGATMSTHLGNGAHSMVPRHDNYIVHQLADDRLYAGLIVDGIHLPPPFAKVALRAKGPSRAVLVTDAVAPAHCSPGLYMLGEQEVELLPEQRVELTSSRRLAGSALSMDRGVANACRFGGLSLFDATRLATSNAGEAMDIPERSGYLEVGQAADFTLFRCQPDGTLAVDETLTWAH